MNYEHLPVDTKFKVHADYALLYNNKTYLSKVPKTIGYHRVQVIKFFLPIKKNKIVKEVKVKILDKKYKLSYTATNPVMEKPKVKKRIAICVYISNYNSLVEFKSWLAYNMMIGVDTVIVYAVGDVYNIKYGIRHLIQNGFVRWYSYNWPLKLYRMFLQRSLQISQINSCYNRHRYEYEYFINIDIDEYVISKNNPFDIYSSVVRNFNKSNDIVLMPSYIYLTKEDINREEELRNGSFFDTYKCYLDNKKTGRKKMIISSRNTGFLGIHDCRHCKIKAVNDSDFRIFHMKKGIPYEIEDTFDSVKQYCTSNYSHYTPKLQELLRTIF